MEFGFKEVGSSGLIAVLIAWFKYRRRVAAPIAVVPAVPSPAPGPADEYMKQAIGSLKNAVSDIQNAVGSLLKVHEKVNAHALDIATLKDDIATLKNDVMEHGVKIEGLTENSVRHRAEAKDIRREAEDLEERVLRLEERRRN